MSMIASLAASLGAAGDALRRVLGATLLYPEAGHLVSVASGAESASHWHWVAGFRRPPVDISWRIDLLFS